MKPKPRGARRTITLASAFALVALACASQPEMVWVKPGATDAKFYRMRAYCRNQKGVGTRFITCMQNDGWVQVPKREAMPREIAK
jgi:hypothetical protein